MFLVLLQFDGSDTWRVTRYVDKNPVAKAVMTITGFSAEDCKWVIEEFRAYGSVDKC